MPVLRELLIDQLQGLLDAETQLTSALPKMSDAANHPKLKEAFDKHLMQTEGHVERLRQVLSILGEEGEPKQCRAMTGLIEEGNEKIQEAGQMDPIGADLSLIAAAQRVEHYEISAYGTARALARQMGEIECAKLLSHTLGEEESTDFLLTVISEPLVQRASLDDMGGKVNLDRATPQMAQREMSRERRSQRTA